MMALPSWLLRETQRDTHSHVSVFVGPDADHRALAGTIVLDRDEFNDLVALMQDDTRRVDVELVFDSPP